jgi:predicted phosphate transport protein (TIGR00153 family)
VETERSDAGSLAFLRMDHRRYSALRRIMFKKLLPKDRHFFELFERQTAVISRGLDLFGSLLNEYSRRKELTAQIKAVENESDDVAHEVFNLLNNTFVTPFDREDIRVLVHRMDDIMDLIEKAAARMEIFDLPAPPVNTDRMHLIIRRAFDKISRAIVMLNKDQKHHKTILQLCVEINSLENDGDAVLRESLARLFKEASDPFYLIKAKEIYESLEDATDRCEDVANILETILIKNA